MHVLISNDDGIGAPGLRCLVQAFAQAGHRVTVAAPDGQRSAASHSITLFRPLTLRRAEWAAANVEAWAIDGTPADCVKFALDRLTSAVDAVVSGVNDGYNIGTDVHYSGTVAAAMEGAFAGVPAIAVSAPHGRDAAGRARGLAGSAAPGCKAPAAHGDAQHQRAGLRGGSDPRQAGGFARTAAL